MSKLIEGVVVKELNLHRDERGFFAEIFRKKEKFFNAEFAQVSFSLVFQGIAKAWHLHKKQTDWMCALSGDMKLVLYDTRIKSKTSKVIMEILLGETLGFKVVRIPPGVAHGYKVMNGPARILYIMNREYDPEDELRIPHDDPEINYDWVSMPRIK